TLGWTGLLALGRGGLGVNAASIAANLFFGRSGSTGAPSFIQPAFSNLSGVAATAQGGLPTGGSTGQHLEKNSATNYDTVWRLDDLFASSIANQTFAAVDQYLTGSKIVLPAAG